VLADAKTSGLTPCWIWAASSSDPANEKRVLPSANCLPYWPNASCSDAAADTTSGPDSAVVAAEVDDDEEELSLPQAASASRQATAMTVTDSRLSTAILSWSPRCAPARH